MTTDHMGNTVPSTTHIPSFMKIGHCVLPKVYLLGWRATPFIYIHPYIQTAWQRKSKWSFQHSWGRGPQKVNVDGPMYECMTHGGIRARSQIPVYGLTGWALGGRSAVPGTRFCGQNLGIKCIPWVGTHLWITMVAKYTLSYCQIYLCE